MVDSLKLAYTRVYGDRKEGKGPKVMDSRLDGRRGLWGEVCVPALLYRRG